MSHEDFLNLAPVYALGALDGDDLAQFRGHLPGCRSCQTTVREFEEAGHELALDLPPVTPPPGLKEKIMHAVRAPQQGQVIPATFGFTRVAAIAAVLALAVSTWFLRDAYQKLALKDGAFTQLHKEREEQLSTLRNVEADLKKKVEDYKKAQDALKEMSERVLTRTEEVARLDAEKKRLEGEMARTAKDIERLKKMDALIRDIKASVVALKGTDLAKDATGRVFWKDQDVVFIADLPPLPAGKVYELWALVDGAPGPVPAGIYDASGNKTADYSKLAQGAKIKGWAISREEKPVDAPTEILFLPAP